MVESIFLLSHFNQVYIIYFLFLRYFYLPSQNLRLLFKIDGMGKFLFNFILLLLFPINKQTRLRIFRAIISSYFCFPFLLRLISLPLPILNLQF